jgi:hypothetical protein
VLRRGSEFKERRYILAKHIAGRRIGAGAFVSGSRGQELADLLGQRFGCVAQEG